MGLKDCDISRTCWMALLALTACLLAGCEKAKLDEEVRRLCAQDGGIKIYETVKLPSEAFDQWGGLTFYKPTQGENALGPSYIFQSDTRHYKKGDPAMWRSHVRVVRKADQKLLGESISYARRGGDVPSPLHPSSFGCPDDRGEVRLLERVFLR
jgi:hypothetical protein